MPRRLIALIAGLLLAQFTVAADLPSPESFLGHPVGADRQLAPYPKVLEYLRLVADASDLREQPAESRSLPGDRSAAGQSR
jgi:hypothetical protein